MSSVYTSGARGPKGDTPEFVSVSNPDQGANLPAGAVVTITKATGENDVYKVVKDTVFGDLATHVFALDADLVLMRRGDAKGGKVPVPTGHTAPIDFDIYCAGHGRFATTLDRADDYRAAFITDYDAVYYIDNVNGDDSNDGATIATAKKTHFYTRQAADGAGQKPLVYLVNSGKAYDQSDGLTHTAKFANDVSFIGIADEFGNLPIVGNIYPSTAFAFSKNGTDSHISQASLATATQVGRIFDKSKLRSVNGLLVPTEYRKVSTYAECVSEIGTFWITGSNDFIYLNTFNGELPQPSFDVLFTRGTITAQLASRGKSAFAENLIFVGGITEGDGLHPNIHFLNCASVGSNFNGFSQTSSDNFGTKDCISIDSAQDGFNYHSAGQFIETVTLDDLNDFVKLRIVNHGLTSGQTVSIYEINGMEELNWQKFEITVLNVDLIRFYYPDVTTLSPYISGGKVGAGNPRFHAINPIAINSGVTIGSMQSTSAHENCEGWTINPLFYGSYRDNVTDIQKAKHVICGGYLGSNRIADGQATDARMVFAADDAQIALMGVEWGGYTQAAQPFSGGAGQIKLLDTVAPYDLNKWSGITTDWSE